MEKTEAAPTKVIDKSKEEKAKSIRGAFPRLSLKKVLELTDAMFEEAQGDPVRRRDILVKINRKPDSSNSIALIQASNAGYSLIEGNKNSSHLELNDKSKSISNSESLSPQRMSEIYDVLFSNQFFSAVINKYKDRPFPSDSVAIDFLVREQKLSQSDAEVCWTTIKDNINDFGLSEESGGKKIILARDLASSKVGANGISTPTSAHEVVNGGNNIGGKVDNPMQIAKEEEKKTGLQPKSFKLTPQVTFNVQIVLPDNATPETYEAIFASMATHLLGRNEE